MKARLQFVKIKALVAARTHWWLLRQWRYALLALGAAFMFFELIYWLFNTSVLRIVLASANLSMLEKLHFVVNPLWSLADTNGVYTAILMIAISLVQGQSVAALVYTLRHQQKFDAVAITGGSVAGFLAIIGLGCPACGTSLVTPIVAIFVSGSAIAVSESITHIALPLALLVGLYGLYAIGLKAASARATSNG